VGGHQQHSWRADTPSIDTYIDGIYGYAPWLSTRSGSQLKSHRTSMTQLYAIIGDPIAQVRSPEVFNQLFHRRGVDAIMVPMLVHPGEFGASLFGLRAIENVGGLIVTVPHKTAAARLVKTASRRVTVAMAANALRPCSGGWEGELFDGEGFATGMEAEGHELKGTHCALVGCGGAGAAIALALLERNVASLSIWDVDQTKAADLAQRLHSAVPLEIRVSPPSSKTDVVINATPLGMAEDDPVPIRLDMLRQGALVADAIMKPSRTRLLREAQKLGHSIQEGHHMLDNQVQAIWSFFGLP
jgi:shikimate dehydrogenase